jgi:hypothetical protein
MKKRRLSEVPQTLATNPERQHHLMEGTMPVKKNTSNAKKANKVAGKRHAKLIAPKGEKISSMAIMKLLDKTHPILISHC